MNYATIEGFEKMSKQRLFDMSATHLLKQGCRSHDHGQCLYDGPNNTTCAAGIFLKPERRRGCDYAQHVRGASWSILEIAHLVPHHVHAGLICDLQLAHDATSERDFRGGVTVRLLDVARRYQLNPAVLEKTS